MILAHTVRYLTTFTPSSLAQVVANSGFNDNEFKTADFTGITNGGQFAYRVSFFDKHKGQDRVGQVFVKYDNLSQSVSADY